MRSCWGEFGVRSRWIRTALLPAVGSLTLAEHFLSFFSWQRPVRPNRVLQTLPSPPGSGIRFELFHFSLAPHRNPLDKAEGTTSFEFELHVPVPELRVGALAKAGGGNSFELELLAPAPELRIGAPWPMPKERTLSNWSFLLQCQSSSDATTVVSLVS